MKRVIGAADFASLRRQLSGQALAALVGRIEVGFRAALGVATLTDDAIVVATLEATGQTETERAGLAVIRACIGYREAPEGARNGWLDQLAATLAVADAAGIRRQHKAAGGAETGAQRKAKAAPRNAKIEREAEAIRAMRPGITQKALAATLAERGLGTVATLLKKIAHKRKS